MMTAFANPICLVITANIPIANYTLRGEARDRPPHKSFTSRNVLACHHIFKGLDVLNVIPNQHTTQPWNSDIYLVIIFFEMLNAHGL